MKEAMTFNTGIWIKMVFCVDTRSILRTKHIFLGIYFIVVLADTIDLGSQFYQQNINLCCEINVIFIEKY